MAYCSVEEAWGAPLTPPPDMFQSYQGEPQSSEFVAEETQTHSSVAPPNSDQFEGSITDPPLRGSFPYGSIPDPYVQRSDETQRQGQKEEEKKVVDFKLKNNIQMDQLKSNTQKMDKIIEIVSKKTCTSWTDVIIFVLIGIFTIIILNVFMRVSRWLISQNIHLKSIQYSMMNNSQINAPSSQMAQMPQMSTVPNSNMMIQNGGGFGGIGGIYSMF
jgi:hypothetical protein